MLLANMETNFKFCDLVVVQWTMKMHTLHTHTPYLSDLRAKLGLPNASAKNGHAIASTLFFL